MNITEWLHGRQYDEAAAEITSLRAELAVNNELYAIAQSDLAAVSLQYDAATAVIDRLESEASSLRAELAENETALEFANRQWGERGIECHELRATAHQDAEEKTRLREALRHISGLDERVNSIPLDKAFRILREMGSIARAALACRPQGEKS